MMVFPNTLRTLAAFTLLTLPGCGRSPESKVAHAINAAFPDGQRRCLGLAGIAVGIHVAAGAGETLWFPATGVTSPLHHAFVFWAARADAPVPELVADLAGRGILTKATVEATADAEITQLGPQTVSRGYYDHPTLYRHRMDRYPVDIYTTKPFDDWFDYAQHFRIGSTFDQSASLPSRLYDVALPPPDQHYLVPTMNPYALSVVTSACFPETLGGVDAVRVKEAIFGGEHYVEADVRYDEHPARWMLTHAFRRAAIGPDTSSIIRPRLATVTLTLKGADMSYLREDPR